MIPTTQNDQFDFNPAQYADAGRNAILPLPGEYVVKATSANLRSKDGNLVTRKDDNDNTYRVVVVNRIEIVEPEEENGQFSIFQDLNSKPYKRKGMGNQMVPVSNVMDAIRAIDVTLSNEPTGWDDACDVLLREFQSGSTFNARLGYKVVDIDGAKADLKSISDDDTDGKRKAWAENTFYTSAFRNPDGSYNSAVKSKDGERVLEAKLVIDAFVASNKRGKIGPFARKS